MTHIRSVKLPLKSFWCEEGHVVPRLNDRLRELSARKGSIARVCRDLGVNRQQFNRYLSGDITPRLPMLQKLARYFDVSMESLMGGERQVAPALPDTPPSDFATQTGHIFAKILHDTQAQSPSFLKDGFYIQHYLLRRHGYSVISMPLYIRTSKLGPVLFKRNLKLMLNDMEVRCKFDGFVFSIKDKSHILYYNTTMNNSIGILQFSHQIYGYPNLFAGIYLVKSSINAGDSLSGRTLLEYLGPKLKFSQFRNRLGCRNIDDPAIPDIVRAKLMPKGQTQVIAAFEVE